MLVALIGFTACPPARVPAASKAAPGQSVESTLAQAEVAFALRPDVGQVQRSLELFARAASGDPARVEGCIGVVRSVAWLMEHGVSRADRRALVDEAVAAGAQCGQRSPGAASCEYWYAVALGLSARERPLTALGELKTIIELLRRAEAKEPGLDECGPARVLALLLVRAPGWPVGPGSPDDALTEARKAVARGPAHPLNHLALAECLAATGEQDAARVAYQQAVALGRARGDADGADWVAQAESALKKLEL